MLKYVLDHLKTQTMCERALEDEPDSLEFVPDNLKTKTMCERAVEEFLGALQLISDHFIHKKCVKG